MSVYEKCREELLSIPRKWLITGVAGFIGSNLLEQLLALNQNVIGLDNFSTGHHKNINEVLESVKSSQARNFMFIEGDIRNLDTCHKVCQGAEIVLHEAALGSVPRSISDPVATNQSNIDGFLNMLIAARDAKVKKFVYAGSSSTYGDHPGLPKVENVIGKPLSPYAVTKYVNELYASVFAQTYGTKCIGLRYFNVFGRRQDPDSTYAAVIPKWFAGLLKNEPIYINGDGETSRDFCYIDNAVQANLLAAIADIPQFSNSVYNVAFGERTTLNQLFELIREQLIRVRPMIADVQPVYREIRPGDVRHSLADITKAQLWLGYQPTHSVKAGLSEAVSWYVEHLS